LVTIGAHTKNHFSLAKLTQNELIDEIVDSKAIIESRLGISVKHFCYPFGGKKEAGVREFKLIKDLGFDTAVTTRFGNIFPEHSEHLTSLPRVMLTNHFSWATFHFRSLKQMLKGRVVSV
jgi:peptidoglycan/xylan/chitin deacetylase (PgdA/CDA1 family)